MGKKIEDLGCIGETSALKTALAHGFTQIEIDRALSCALAYSRLETATYLITIGADITYNDYEGIYYAVHNNELSALKFSIAHGVDINVNEGMILNGSIITTINSKDLEMIKWIVASGGRLDLLTDQSRGLVSEYGSQYLQGVIAN